MPCCRRFVAHRYLYQHFHHIYALTHSPTLFCITIIAIQYIGEWEPVNPYSCGEDFSCGYENRCLAESAGFNIEEDCCQAPQPSACPMIFDPLVCGSKKCPYSNSCIAELAGYTPDTQCEAPPEECPAGTKDCSMEPANPYTCGSSRCPYATICEAEDAGWDLGADCCQDTRGATACTADNSPVSCGPPGGE